MPLEKRLGFGHDPPSAPVPSFARYWLRKARSGETGRSGQRANPNPGSQSEGSCFEQMAERSGRFANPQGQVEGLVELLMEPTGRAARRRAVEAIRDLV